MDPVSRVKVASTDAEKNPDAAADAAPAAVKPFDIDDYKLTSGLKPSFWLDSRYGDSFVFSPPAPVPNAAVPAPSVGPAVSGDEPDVRFVPVLFPYAVVPVHDRYASGTSTYVTVWTGPYSPLFAPTNAEFFMNSGARMPGILYGSDALEMAGRCAAYGGPRSRCP